MVYFVGAGPGAEDLITVRGLRYLENADVIIYAGSLVNKALLKSAKEGCQIYNSAYMTLEEVIAVRGGAGIGYSLPAVSQSVIISRAEGRTPVPERESIRKLAVHQSTMVLFLSSGLAGKVKEELLAGGYAADTPAAVVFKATWEEEKLLYTTVGRLPEDMKQEGIDKTALIIVGNVLGGEYQKSKLFDASFTTGFRRGI